MTKSKKSIAVCGDGLLGWEECASCEAGRKVGPCRQCHGQTVVPTSGRLKGSGLFIFATTLERWPSTTGVQGGVDRYLGSDAHFAYDVRIDREGLWSAMASTWDFDGSTGMSCTVLGGSAAKAAQLLEAELLRVAGCVRVLETGWR